MARTMDDLRAPAQTWGSDIKTYEHGKRHAVDAALVTGQQLSLKSGAFQYQERVFDPVLQRYRDNNVEASQRHHEERERVAHLNRAADIQILREQPFHILHGASKLEKLAPGKDPMRLGGHGTLGEKERSKHGKGNFPDTAVDYNIVSNIPMRDHHWAREDERPRLKEKSPRDRKVPAFLAKDFDIVNNRYSDNHSEKLRQEKRVHLLEGTDKHLKRNFFDPVVGRFIDPAVEEKVKTVDHAREVEITMRAHDKVPPSYKGRQTAAYGITSHEKHDPDLLRVYDNLENERKDRYKNRYIVEHNLHAQDIKGDHINQVRIMNRVAPERYEEQKKRGYDIIDGKAWGPGAKEKHFNEAFPKTRQTPWEKVEVSRQYRESVGLPTGVPATSSTALNPDQVSTLKLPADTIQASGRQKLESSSSAQQLRRSHAPSVRSEASSMRRSASAAAMGGPPRMGQTPYAPPPPAVPGSPMGSVYSRPSRA